ncbi:MAG: yegX [Bacteroidetes bacterium]|nr:yegX [Bacteroidota bacterium]
MAKVNSSRRRPSKNKKSNQTVRLIVRVVLVLSFVALGYFIFHKLYPDYRDFDETGFYNQFEMKGIDLSHHNEVISWNAVRDKDISFVYLKVTEGSSLCDREYKKNYRQAKACNIKVGTYHFFSFRTPGEVQAKHFIGEAICKKGDLIPAIDVEHSPGNKYSSQKEKRDKVVAELKVFEKKLRTFYGRLPVIYTNKECYELYIKNHFPKNPIWICDLSNKPNDNTISNWVIWQFSHKGKIPGTSGKIDLNYYRYSFDRFKELIL